MPPHGHPHPRTTPPRSLAWLLLALLAGALPLAALAFGQPRAFSQAHAQQAYTVCLDPGHDPSGDVGAVTTAQLGRHSFPIREVDLNLDIAHALRRRLQALGISVLMTWDGASLGWPEVGAPDLPPAGTPDDIAGLEARGRHCVQAGAHVMFSVHHNALPGPGNGLTTLFRDPGSGQRDHDRAVARIVHDTMWSLLHPGKASRGFTDFGLLFRNWGIARGAIGIPAVILEPVVITDPTEALRLLPTIAQGGLRRQQIVRAELAAILAAEPVVNQRVESTQP